jgi:dTDP-4-dehydrorhamnose reductase
LGQAFARACHERGLAYRSIDRSALDSRDPAEVGTLLDALRPWAVVNTAALLSVDEAELRPESAFLEYAQTPACIAHACSDRKIRLLTFSSDLVFDGAQRRPYIESDTTLPLNVFGRSKLEAEQRVLAADPSALVVRTSALHAPWDERTFGVGLLRAWQRRQRVRVPSDRVLSPTYVPDLVRACLDFLIDGEHGIWHLANGGEVTPAAFAKRIAEVFGTQPYLEECASADLSAAPRPAYSALGSERGEVMPRLDESLEHFFQDVERYAEGGAGKAA